MQIPAPENLVWEISGEDAVELGGAERKNFLNSYVTQDIKTLAADQVVPAAFLTQKGKLVSSARVFNLPDKLFILLPPGYGAMVRAHLDTYLQFASVEWRPCSGAFVHFAGMGARAAERIQHWLGARAPEPAQLLHVPVGEAEGWFFANEDFATAGWELIVPSTAAPRVRAQLAAWEREGAVASADPETLETLRIEAGLPKMGVDMGEDNLVAEVGLDTRATSFTKGCYLGQETTARVQSRGHVNRKLTRVRLEREYAGPLPAELMQGGKKAGALTSARRSARFDAVLGLATVQLSAWESGEPLWLPGAAGNIKVEKY